MAIGVSLSEPTLVCLAGKCVSTYVHTYIFPRLDAAATIISARKFVRLLFKVGD